MTRPAPLLQGRRGDGMLSKSASRARTLLSLVLLTSCTSPPWSDEPAHEVNLAFVLQDNLLYLPTVAIGGRGGRYLLGTAAPRSVIDPALAATLRPARRGYRLSLGEGDSIRFDPVPAALGGVGDAIVGADVWGHHAVTIDYHAELVTYQKAGIHRELMLVHGFDGPPSIIATVDGREVPAIVDTASPDTLVLPRGARAAGRASARVSVAGTDFGTIDVALAGVSQARIGNRLLSKFLVTIDYGRRQVGLWRDPRIPL